MAATKRTKLQLLFDLAQRTFAEHAGQPTPPQVEVLKLALSEWGACVRGRRQGAQRHSSTAAQQLPAWRRARRAGAGAAARPPCCPAGLAHPLSLPGPLCAAGSVPLAELGIQHSEECACAEESCPGRKVECSGELRFDPDAHAGPRCAACRCLTPAG